MKRNLRRLVAAVVVVMFSQGALTAQSESDARGADATALELSNEKFRHEMELKLRDIQHENSLIQAQLERRESDMGNYIDAISWVSGVVIGFVGVLFGIGAFILYRENKDVTSRAQAQLDAWDEEASKLQSRFDKWFRDSKGV
ncbi:MAG: hypothetical protein AAF525_22140 [Pseudomonadota bacterium]